MLLLFKWGTHHSIITNLWDQVFGFLYNACIYTTYVCLIIPDFRLLLRFFVVPKQCYKTGWVPQMRLGLCHLGHLGLRKTIVVLVSMLKNRYISIIQEYKLIMCFKVNFLYQKFYKFYGKKNIYIIFLIFPSLKKVPVKV